MTDLDTRRAEFVYEAARHAAVLDGSYPREFVPMPWDRVPWQKRTEYAVAVRDQIVTKRPPRELHLAWMAQAQADGWKYGKVYDHRNKTHPELVPYEQISKWKMDKELLFIELCDLAGRFIR